jgi:hypothetical protein
MMKKRAYVAPFLAKYGSMKTLTLAGGGSCADSLGQMPETAFPWETTAPCTTGF